MGLVDQTLQITRPTDGMGMISKGPVLQPQIASSSTKPEYDDDMHTVQYQGITINDLPVQYEHFNTDY